MGIVGALVMGFLVNNILFGIESYINQKYTADNTMIYCRSYGRIATRLLLDRCISSNKEAEKEANFIISATGWAYEVPFFLGALIEIRRRREIARVLKNKIN